jgi:hypothetical protein
MRVRLVAACSALVGLLAASPARADDDGGGMQSPAAFGIGLFLSGVGAAGLATGGYLFASAGDPCGEISRERVPTSGEIADCQTGVNKKVGGVIAMVTGGAFFLGGIPLIAVGATPEDEQPKTRATLDIGPTSGRFRLEF